MTLVNKITFLIKQLFDRRPVYVSSQHLTGSQLDAQVAWLNARD